MRNRSGASSGNTLARTNATTNLWRTERSRRGMNEQSHWRRYAREAAMKAVPKDKAEAAETRRRREAEAEAEAEETRRRLEAEAEEEETRRRREAEAEAEETRRRLEVEAEEEETRRRREAEAEAEETRRRREAKAEAEETRSQEADNKDESLQILYKKPNLSGQEVQTKLIELVGKLAEARHKNDGEEVVILEDKLAKEVKMAALNPSVDQTELSDNNNLEQLNGQLETSNNRVKILEEKLAKGVEMTALNPSVDHTELSDNNNLAQLNGQLETSNEEMDNKEKYTANQWEDNYVHDLIGRSNAINEVVNLMVAIKVLKNKYNSGGKRRTRRRRGKRQQKKKRKTKRKNKLKYKK